MSKRTRDRAIAQANFCGKSRYELAAEYDLTPRRISQIIASQRELMGTPTGRRDAFRALNWENRGRPKLFIPDGERPHYVKLRRVMGAAYARDAMGLNSNSYSHSESAKPAARSGLDGEVALFLRKHAMYESTFGRYALNNASFAARLRQGMVPRKSTAAKVRVFMARRDV